MRIAALLLILAGCSAPARASLDGFYDFCCQRAGSGELILDVLAANRIDATQNGGSFGGLDILVRGDQGTFFRARELVLEYVKTRGWDIGWPADSVVLQEDHPWMRIAEVAHRRTSTAEVVIRLQAAGLKAFFWFGEHTDLIFIRREDSVRAGHLLRDHPYPGVVVHDSP
jgi:hypothetical protein